LERRARRLDAVIDFQMSDELIIERIAQRRVCSVCKKTYNTRFVPPKVDGKCDDCGGALEQRVDDHADVLATRLETYRVQTAPLIDYYESRGLLHTVDASADAAGVEARVAGVIEGLVSDG